MILAFDFFSIIDVIIFGGAGIFFLTIFIIVFTSIIKNVKNAKNISKDIFDIQNKVVQEIKKDDSKVTCEYCSSKIDANLSKCPYCSASVKNKGEK